MLMGFGFGIGFVDSEGGREGEGKKEGSQGGWE